MIEGLAKAVSVSKWTDDGTTVSTREERRLKVTAPSATSGSPIAFHFSVDEYNGISNSDLNDIKFDLSRTITLLGGGSTINDFRSCYILGPTIAASSPQTITYPMTLAVTPPIAGSNVTFSTSPAAAGFYGDVKIGSPFVNKITLTASNGNISTAGSVSFSGSLIVNTSNTGTTIRGNVDNSSSAIANKLTNLTSLTAIGSKIVSFYSDNGITEKAYIDKDGTARIRGLKTQITTISDNYTVTTADYTVLADASSSALTVTLPSANQSSNSVFVIKKIDSSSNAVTIAASSGDAIEGASNINLTSQYNYRTLQSDGNTTWYIISQG